MKYRFTVVTHREGDVYVATCLESDVSSFGGTREEARAMVTEALELHHADQEPPDRLDSPELTSIEITIDGRE